MRHGDLRRLAVSQIPVKDHLQTGVLKMRIIIIIIIRGLGIDRELNKTWNMRVTVIPIVVGALETIFKDMEKSLEELEIRGRINTIQTSALLRLARILRVVLAT